MPGDMSNPSPVEFGPDIGSSPGSAFGTPAGQAALDRASLQLGMAIDSHALVKAVVDHPGLIAGGVVGAGALGGVAMSGMLTVGGLNLLAMATNGLYSGVYMVSRYLQIPQSIMVAGQKLFIEPSGIKHVFEFAQRSATFTTPLSQQLLGESYMAAITAAAESGIVARVPMVVSEWELIFKMQQDTWILYHAQPFR
jgi:hypothetical protein